ncbi:hypothetical protein EYF80_034844 [Liparis tanakae]|uniref:Uncharacterized protein n=1 Tax=Liparis tanakae TaxID=230148 RepID=A0A4Z2GN87_9TELE|nr:hypothetical protein EYF80_034844 [Liparis tanakae]
MLQGVLSDAPATRARRLDFFLVSSNAGTEKTLGLKRISKMMSLTEPTALQAARTASGARESPAVAVWTSVSASGQKLASAEPAVGAQQPLSVHRGEQGHFVVVGPQQDVSLQGQTFGRLSQELQEPPALGGLLGSCVDPVQQASRAEEGRR